MFFKIDLLKTFTKFTGEKLCRTLFFDEWRETPTKAFSCEFYKNFKNAFFIKANSWLFLGCWSIRSYLASVFLLNSNDVIIFPVSQHFSCSTLAIFKLKYRWKDRRCRRFLVIQQTGLVTFNINLSLSMVLWNFEL